MFKITGKFFFFTRDDVDFLETLTYSVPQTRLKAEKSIVVLMIIICSSAIVSLGVWVRVSTWFGGWAFEEASKRKFLSFFVFLETMN